MKRIIIAVMVVIFASGCSHKRIRSEVQTVKVPLLYCPAPPAIEQPSLPIHHMTPAQHANDGEVVKHYRATTHALLGYIAELEHALQSYDATNAAYGELRKKFQDEWKKEFTDSGKPR